jgi:hypothetical protein
MEVMGIRRKGPVTMVVAVAVAVAVSVGVGVGVTWEGAARARGM